MADMRSLAAKRTSGAMTPQTFAATLLNRLGIHQTPGAVQAIVGWAKAEGGHWNNSATFNPLNTTENTAGARPINSVGVKAYPSWQAGLDATVQTLRSGRYGGILSALAAGDPGRVASAIGSSPWGTSASLAQQAILGIPRMAGVHAQAPSGASAGTQAAQTTTTPTFDQAGFQTARRRFALGQLLSSQGQAKDNPLFATGLVTMSAPNPQDFTGTKTSVQAAPQRSSGTSAPSGKGGVQDFAGQPVAGWIAPILQYARQHGWSGSVQSGYRSYAAQRRIYDSGVRPAAVPGTSNHEFTAFPGGAVDVTNAQQLAQILAKSKYARLLQWAGSKDPVHFSHPHGGSY